MGQGVEIDSDTNCIVDVNPATGEVIEHVPCTKLEDIDDMMTLSKKSQMEWSTKVSLKERISYLKQGIQALSGKQDQLAKLITEEMGKPLVQSIAEVEGALKDDDYFNVLEESLTAQKRGINCVVVRKALGVVVVCSPWNFPMDEILLLTLPALASGNVVVVKPSEVTPLVGALVVQTLQAVLPSEGILQLAQGDGIVGAALTQHSCVDLIAMTGSSATGRKILSNASSEMKRVVLELGGKDPMIVFEDASLLEAAKDAVKYSLDNTGQVCCSIERIYVASSIYKKFQELVVEEAKTYKIGNPMDLSTNVGPMVSQNQLTIVQTHVQDATDKGATLLYQSEVPSERYFPVTVLADITPDMTMYYEETFGPVVCLMSFDGTEDEAIRLANDTPYGLASAVYTSDISKAARVASSINAGQTSINGYCLDQLNFECPWIGHKCSGYGGYHSGYEGIQQFSLPQTISFPLSNETNSDSNAATAAAAMKDFLK